MGTATVQSQPSASVKTLEIHSKWSGLGPTENSTLRIEQRKTEYRTGGKRVDSMLVEELLREIDLTSEKSTLQNLGITESWLQSNVETALPKRLRDHSQNEKDLFLTSFRDIRLIEELLPHILRQGWTDDFPSIELRIVRNNGSTMLLTSERQNIFMTPFLIDQDGSARLSYNADLSRAIAALLPKGFTNRERLEGDHLASEVADSVMFHINDDLNLLETRNRIGPELKPLEDRYTLKETKVGYLSSVDIETMGENFPRWNAKLLRKDLPKNVEIGISLPLQNSRLTNFDLFLKDIDAIVSLPLSVPWLAQYLSEHPETLMEIRFVTNRSMSPKAVSYFVETMKTLKAESLLAEAQPLLDLSTFVEFSSPHGWSRWVALPDRRMILFDFQGDTALRWELRDFDTQIRYDTRFWHMAKAVISPQGQIRSK